MNLPALVMPAVYSEDWRFAYAMSVGAGGAGCRRKPDGEVIEVFEVVQVVYENFSEARDESPRPPGARRSASDLVGGFPLEAKRGIRTKD